MNIIKQILQYLLSFYLLFMSLGFLIIGGKSIIGAIISLTSALIILPFFRNIIENSLNLKFGKLFKYFVPFIGFFAPLFFIDFDKIENSSINKNDFNSTTIKTDSVNKPVANILPIAGISNTKNNIVETPKKKQSKTIKKSNYSNESKISYKKAKKDKIKRVKTQKTTYQPSSGLCGHPNKTGGNCKRRVKGGGYCWQHS